MVDRSLNYISHVSKFWKLQHFYKQELKYFAKRAIHRLALCLLEYHNHVSTVEHEAHLGGQVMTPPFIHHRWEVAAACPCQLGALSPFGHIENSKACVQSTGEVCKARRCCQEEQGDGWSWFIQELEALSAPPGQGDEKSAEIKGPASESRVIRGLRKVVPDFRSSLPSH